MTTELHERLNHNMATLTTSVKDSIRVSFSGIELICGKSIAYWAPHLEIVFADFRSISNMVKQFLPTPKMPKADRTIREAADVQSPNVFDAMLF